MADQINTVDVEAILKEFADPETGRSVVQMDQVKNLSVDGQQISIDLGLTTHSAPLWNDAQTDLSERVKAKFPSATISVNVVEHERPAGKMGEIGLTAKSVIAVGSGKGGVGKSTIASVVALGLKRAGCKVGLLDADVYGPSIPHLFGLSGQPVMNENKQMVPITWEGMPVNSMGFMVPREEAVVWRGPMLHGAIIQMLRDTAWGDLDYLIIDMPPGTGDIALTLSQAIAPSGAVVVCTPQEVALLDAVKAIAMFRKVRIPVLGMVENMSGFVCPDCNKKYDIFGSGGARQEAERLEVPFLGEVPINIQIRERGDAGQTPNVFDDPQLAPYLERMCYQLVRGLAMSARQNPPQPQLPVLG